MTYQFIDSQTGSYPAVALCRALGVSRSGYYAWADRAEADDELSERVAEVFRHHSRRYGSRRIAAELRAAGQRVGRRRVRRLMREQGLRAIQPRRFVPRTTDSRHHQRLSPNLLRERERRVDRPLKALVGDITYLPLRGGEWAYLATWLDLYSRKVVGWQVSESMTAAIVTSALRQAIARQQPARGLVVHSDRGGQYVATEFRELLRRQGFEQSMSRPGRLTTTRRPRVSSRATRLNCSKAGPSKMWRRPGQRPSLTSRAITIECGGTRRSATGARRSSSATIIKEP